MKNFLRKSIAAQSYSKMFSQGTSFKSLNLSIEAPSGARSSFRSLEHLDKVSRHYISEIIQKVHPLSSDERHLHFDNAIPPVFYHEHQSFFLDNFKEVVDEVSRYVHSNQGKTDVP
ncbi:T3SS effector OspC family protein, partial [Escherichia coli]|nr:T3SS effector OspC family protein [Escherichia coli]